MNDVFKKNLLKRGLNPWECMALLNTYGAVLSLLYCLYTNQLPYKMETGILWGGFLTSIGKNLYITYFETTNMLILPYDFLVRNFYTTKDFKSSHLIQLSLKKSIY